jgi:hypothetical protein
VDVLADVKDTAKVEEARKVGALDGECATILEGKALEGVEQGLAGFLEAGVDCEVCVFGGLVDVCVSKCVCVCVCVCVCDIAAENCTKERLHHPHANRASLTIVPLQESGSLYALETDWAMNGCLR